jgi:pilus assembly protein CpaD
MRTLLTLMVLVAISGCKATADRPLSEYTQKNKVDLVRFEHEVMYRNGARDPSNSERARLDAFFRNIQVGAGDAILLDGGSPGQRIALGARLAYRHLSVQQTGVNGTPGRVNVLVERYIVTTPTCPNWSKPVGEDSENTPMTGFGCSNTANLGMMVVNPRDLVRGSTPGPSDGEAVSAAVRRYREGKVTKLLDDDRASGFEKAK